jgi:hypothetical protein
LRAKIVRTPKRLELKAWQRDTDLIGGQFADGLRQG